MSCKLKHFLQCCEVCCCFVCFVLKVLEITFPCLVHCFLMSSILPSWNLLPSTGMSVYLRLYNSFVTGNFKGTAYVCAVCCCFCNFYYHTGGNWLLLRCFPIEFQKCHFIPGLFFPPQSVEFLISVYTSNRNLGRNNEKYFILIVT